MTYLISACGRCWSLRSDPIPAGGFVPANFAWHGCCGQCLRVVVFECVGTKVEVAGPPARTPDDEHWTS